MLGFRALLCQLIMWALLLSVTACGDKPIGAEDPTTTLDAVETLGVVAGPSEAAMLLADGFDAELRKHFMQRLRQKIAERQDAQRRERIDARQAELDRYEAERAQGLKPRKPERLRINIDEQWAVIVPSIKHGALLADLYEKSSPDERVFIDADAKLTQKAKAVLGALATVDEHALEPDDALVTRFEDLAKRLERMQAASETWELVLSQAEKKALALAFDAELKAAQDDKAATREKNVPSVGLAAQDSLLKLPVDKAYEALWARISQPNALVIERAYAAYTRYTERLEQIENFAWALEWSMADAYLSHAERIKFGNLEKYSPEELQSYAKEDSPSVIHPKYYDVIIEGRLREDFLAFSAEEQSAEAHLKSLIPQHPQYAKLQAVRERYRNIVKAGGWSQLKADNMNKGGTAPLVGLLKRRLEAEGYVVGNTSDLFDDALVDAIKAYQRHHQFEETGKVDDGFWRSLNVSAEMRLAEIEANIRRWHWTMYEARERYIYINIPSFEVELWDAGKRVAVHKTVVGSSGRFCNARTREWELMNATVLMHARMTFLVFNPYWNVPPRIEVDEYQPKMAQDPKWLEKSEFEYHSPKGGGRVLRQRPGPTNALGKVKLIFPNRHNIYLHDTPNQDIFGYPIRAFSHGCIRVEGAFDFAQRVLELDGQWDKARVERFFVERGEHAVELKTAIDVFIEYHTVSVDDEGMPNFLADVYRIIKDAIEPPSALDRRCDPSVDRTSNFRTGGAADGGP